MKKFKHFFRIEIKRLFNIIIVIVVLLFFVLSMYFIQNGADRYKDVLNNKENFKKIEQSKVKRHVSYTTFGMEGFRILFVPSPVSIFFFNSGAFSGLSATLDVGERLNLTGSYKGRNMFRDQGVKYADFFGLLLLFGTLSALVYGYLSLRHREYLNLLGSLKGFRKVFNYITATRFLLLGLFFTVLTALGTGLILVNGIRFTGSDYLYIVVFHVLWLLVMLVIFSAGTWIGAVKSTPRGVTLLGLTWICLFYISPLMVNQVTDAISAKMKSIYQLEKEKWDALMGFEERAIEAEGRFKSKNAQTPVERELIESFMEHEYKDMMELEKKYMEEMRGIIKKYGWLSLISPSTFLSWAEGEMSSQGYGSLLDFYEYTWELKDKFCRFYKDKKFYSGKERNGVESFITGEENVYYGGKRLPFNFLWGLIQLIVLIALVHTASYFCHKRALTRVDGKMAAGWDPVSFNAAESKYFAWQIEEEGFSQRMYNHLEGVHDFLYLCHPGLLPGDIGAGDFLDLAAALLGVPGPVDAPNREKRFCKMKNREKCEILMKVTELAHQAGKSHYLFHDFTREMPIGAAVAVKKRMEALKSQGAAVMLFLRQQVVDDDDKGQSYGIREADTWSEQVERWEENF